MKIQDLVWITIREEFEYIDDHSEEERSTPLLVMPLMHSCNRNEVRVQAEKIRDLMLEILELSPYSKLLVDWEYSVPREHGFRVNRPEVA